MSRLTSTLWGSSFTENLYAVSCVADRSGLDDTEDWTAKMDAAASAANKASFRHRRGRIEVGEDIVG